VTSTGPGRPRKQQATRPGATARDEILDAAAELFAGQGYANTSTRAIADAVGIRQSSLYHHFATKDHILAELLNGTVAAGLSFARAIVSGQLTGAARNREPGAAQPVGAAGDEGIAAAARLHAVALFDGTQLCTVRWNLGVLYHLPEARAGRFRPFFDDRNALRQLYRDLGRDVEDVTGLPGQGGLGDMVFRLVESLINLRADDLADGGSAQETADAGTVLAGLGAELELVRSRSADLISTYADNQRLNA
jgi:AcrR family transcriptional regulator